MQTGCTLAVVGDRGPPPVGALTPVVACNFSGSEINQLQSFGFTVEFAIDVCLCSSPFTVNAMDQEELRRSVRRARRQRPAHLTLAPLVSDAGTATQEESEDDLLEEDEEASTPSADTDGQTRAGLQPSARSESC